MKKTISQRFFLSLCLMIVGCLWGSAAWAETVTYTVTSKSTVTTSGSKPSGSSATYSSTYATTAQLIKGKSMTLTLSGYAGKKITGITLSMKSNSNDGAGYLSVKAGTTTLASIGSPSSGVKFNNSAWYGKWSKSYVNVTPTMSNNAYAIQDKEDVVILIGATENSLYCKSFTLTYEDAGPIVVSPTLVVPSNSITFGSVEKGSFKEQSLTISGTNLTADATLEITGTDATMFSVNQTTIKATDGNIAATDVTVTYTPTATGEHNATLTISSGTLEKMVDLTGTGFVPHYISATTYYKKITSSDELVDGGQYVIVYTEGKKGLLAGVNNVHNATPANVVFEDNGTITTANAAAMTEITFEHNAGAKYYLNIGNSKYIKAATSTSTSLNVATGKDNNALWTIGFDGNGNVEITSVAFTNRVIMYSTSSTGFFKNYSVNNRGQAGYPAIQLYQKVGEMPIAKATGYVSTYVADFAYVMPKHITGHTVTLAAEQGVISTSKVFRADDEVPALTPLLIKSDEDYAETSKNYHPAVLNKTVDAYEGDNMLEYRRTAQGLTNTMKDGSVYYYKLAIKNDIVGFYWGAENGAAFTMTKPSTAYLTVPQDMAVQGFVLNLEEGETTGIATVVTNEDAPIYNLQGIRMNGKNLPKGIYIQGGKKFMVK